MPRVTRTRAASAAAVLALGAFGVMAVPGAAQAADTVTANYTCDLPTGAQTGDFTAVVTLDPASPTAGQAVNVSVDLTQVPFTSPLTVNNYDASLTINVSGAETGSFDVTKSSDTGFGAGEPITVQGMTGSWTPTVAGTDTGTPATATVNANVSLLGNVTITCTPNGDVPGVPITVG